MHFFMEEAIFLENLSSCLLSCLELALFARLPAEFGEPGLANETRLRLCKGDPGILLSSWFTDGAQWKSGFSGMPLQDSLRRLGSRRADGFIFRVMSTSGEAALEDFLSRLQARPAPGVPSARP